jgi:hypothetical protein
MSEDDQSFDLAKFAPERVLAQIQELRGHLKDDLLPMVESRADVSLVLPFVRYLDAWASHFGEQLNAPLEFLAFATRNLLEFSLLLPVVFSSAESRILFLNEALRLDPADLHARLSQLFSSVDAHLPASSTEDVDWLPESDVRLAGKRDPFDAWLHKFCSKLMHPTAIMIMVPEAIADDPKRTTLRFAGMQYLGKSYNFLLKLAYSIDHSPALPISSRPPIA